MGTQGIALVTGASSGIGDGFARRLAAEGYALAIVARREERLQQLADALSNRHGTAIDILAADLSNDAGIERVVAYINNSDDLSMLVNNAGFGKLAFFDQMPVEAHLNMLKLHTETPLRLIHAAIPKMRARGGGAIINVSSFGGLVPMPGSATYNATKSFLVFLSDALAYELKTDNIHVQALCPGLTPTEIFEVAGAPAEQLAAPSYAWTSIEQVVNTALNGIYRKKHIVVPGWLYQIAWRLYNFRPIGHLIKRNLVQFTRSKNKS